jgi:hypothetical protein
VDDQGAHYAERGHEVAEQCKGSGNLFKIELLDDCGVKMVACFFKESAEKFRPYSK